jgi:hypothetical protein
MTPFVRLDAAIEEFRAAVEELPSIKCADGDVSRLGFEDLGFLVRTQQDYVEPFSDRLLAAVDIVHAARQRDKNLDDSCRNAGVVTKTKIAIVYRNEAKHNG